MTGRLGLTSYACRAVLAGDAPGTPQIDAAFLRHGGDWKYDEANSPPERGGGDRSGGRRVDGGHRVERGDRAPDAWPVVQAGQPGGEPIRVQRNVEPAHLGRDSIAAWLHERQLRRGGNSDGSYPIVFDNDQVDPSFGVTSPIFLDQITPSGALVNTLAVPDGAKGGNHIVTSFSSKSEIALNLSTSGKQLSFMGYLADPNAIDVSNSNTPTVFDPTTPVPGTNYRVIAEVDKNGKFRYTLTNSYSGNNGRAAIVNDSHGHRVIYMAGNAGNGGNPQPDGCDRCMPAPSSPGRPARPSPPRPRVRRSRWAASASPSSATRSTRSARTPTSAA